MKRRIEIVHSQLSVPDFGSNRVVMEWDAGEDDRLFDQRTAAVLALGEFALRHARANAAECDLRMKRENSLADPKDFPVYLDLLCDEVVDAIAADARLPLDLAK